MIEVITERISSPVRSWRVAEVARDVEEVLQQSVTVLARDALGVELHPVERIGPVLHSHDEAVVGRRRDLEVGGQGLAPDDQRMVARRLESRVEAAEQALAGVVDAARLAVHQRRRADHVATHRLTHRLVTEADSQHRRRRLEAVDEGETDARFVGGARPGRQHDPLGREGRDLIQAYLVVPVDDRLRPQLAEEMDEVVGEAVVVIDDEEFHGATCPTSALTSRPSFPRRRESRWRDPHAPYHRPIPDGFPAARE
jgi:hypothetical protein